MTRRSRLFRYVVLVGFETTARIPLNYICQGVTLMAFHASRRDFLHVGVVGGLGLTLTDFFRMEQAQAEQKDYVSKEGTAKSVIFIYMPGGMCH